VDRGRFDTFSRRPRVEPATGDSISWSVLPSNGKERSTAGSDMCSHSRPGLLRIPRHEPSRETDRTGTPGVAARARRRVEVEIPGWRLRIPSWRRNDEVRPPTGAVLLSAGLRVAQGASSQHAVVTQVSDHQDTIVYNRPSGGRVIFGKGGVCRGQVWCPARHCHHDRVSRNMPGGNRSTEYSMWAIPGRRMER